MRGLYKAALAVLAAGLAIGGCAGYGAGDAGSSLTEAVTPLPVLSRDSWLAAPAGCAGRLHASSTFAVADTAPEFIVALDANGFAICVDTYTSVESELVTVDTELTESLWLGYIATLEVEPLSGPASSSPSSPTDLREHLAPLLGDPHPQPNDTGIPRPQTETEDGDPHPQPNRPTGTSPQPSMNGTDTEASMKVPQGVDQSCPPEA